MKRIFITGASGCIGHYMAEALIQETDHELFFFVRNPAKLKFDYLARPNINIITGDLREINQFADLIKTMNVAILAATSWGGTVESIEINVIKTLELIQLLDPKFANKSFIFQPLVFSINRINPYPKQGNLEPIMYGQNIPAIFNYKT